MAKTFFSFFGLHLISGEKAPLISGENLFFFDLHLISGEKALRLLAKTFTFFGLYSISSTDLRNLHLRFIIIGQRCKRQANLLPLGKVHLHIAKASFRPIATVAALLCCCFVWLLVELRKPSSFL